MTTERGTLLATGSGSSAAKAVGLTTVITALVYAVTLLQQVLYARALGVSADTDALGAALAWAVGTTGLVGTTLATVYLPRFVRAAHAGPEAIALRTQATTIALVVAAALLAVTVLGAPLVATLLAPGGDAVRRETLAGLLRISAPLEVTWPLVWLALGAANARERYVLAAATAMLAPLPVIAILLTGSPNVQLVAIAYVGGTILQLAALWGLVPASRPVLARSASPSQIAARDLLSVGIVFALLSLIPFEVRGLASLHGVGAIAIADYASRLVLAGQQVLLSGLLAVTFTRWSRSPDAPSAAAIDSVQRTLVLVGFVGVATILVLPVVAVDLTRIVLGGGRFGSADADAVGTFVAWMAPGIAGHMLLMVAVRALFAADRIGPLIAAATAAVSITLVVGVLAQVVWGLTGVAAGYSAGYLAAAAVAVWAARTQTSNDAARRSESGAFPIPPRDASVLALHEDVR